MFPPLPSDWSGLHPLVIHFPIALLLVAPVLVVIAMFAKNGRRPYLVSAFVLMAVGTIMTYVAVSTGHAAGEIAEGTGATESLIERHEELAETTRTVFTVLTLVFAAALVVPSLLKRKLEGVAFHAAYGLFLVAYLAGAVVLANTAHQGGMLVHQAGGRAMVAPASGGAARPEAAAPRGEDADDDD
jgi:uncharacterized membrane protein